MGRTSVIFRRRRRVAAVLVAALVVASCSGDDGDAVPTTEPDADGSDDAWGSGERFSVLGGLAQVPADVDVFVEMGDLRAATDLAGLTRPSPSDGDAFTEWVSAVTGGSLDDGVVFVPYLAEFGRASDAQFYEDFAAEVGWSLADVDAFVGAGNPPLRLVAAQGAGLGTAVFPALPEVEPGVVTAGEGSDFTSDIENPTPARPLGAPLRMAASEDIIAVSTSTPLVGAWLEGAGRTLADDPELAAVARALDDAGAYAAVLAATTMPITDGPGVIGLGWTVVDDQAEVVVVYTNPDGDDGIEADLATAWDDIDATGWARPDELEVRDIAATEEVAMVTVRVSESNPVLLYRIFVNRRLPGQFVPDSSR